MTSLFRRLLVPGSVRRGSRLCWGNLATILPCKNYLDSRGSRGNIARGAAALGDKVHLSLYGYGGDPCEEKSDLKLESQRHQSHGTIRIHVDHHNDVG